jgi:serine/threonine protein kinase
MPSSLGRSQTRNRCQPDALARVRDTRLERDVAIKVLGGDFAKDDDRVRRFRIEAQATDALHHPNVLSVFDVGTHEGAPYLVTELLHGETLRDRMDAGRLPDGGADSGRTDAQAHWRSSTRVNSRKSSSRSRMMLRTTSRLSF